MALSATIRRAVLGAAATLRRNGLLVAVSHVPYATPNEYAEGQPGTPVSREAVVEDVRVEVPGPAGVLEVASSRATFLSAVPVAVNDRLVLPGAATARRVLRVDRGVIEGAGGDPFVVIAYVE